MAKKLPSTKDCEKAIEGKLTPERFHHSLCVGKEAKRLAKLYGTDPNKAEVAGLLHDVMKDTDPSEQLAIITDSEIELNDVEQEFPKLWHAISGAIYVRDELGVEDEEIFDAIRWHTTGHRGMSLLEKVLFIADFTSEEREYAGVDEMRELAGECLELAIIEGAVFTICELMTGRLPVGSDLVDAYNDALRAYENHEQTVPVKLKEKAADDMEKDAVKEEAKAQRKATKVAVKVQKKEQRLEEKETKKQRKSQC